MVEALRRGDQVVTQGGIVGKVTEGAGRRHGRGRDRRGRQGQGAEAHHRQVLNKTEPPPLNA
jgi:hypothetical protein